MTEQFIKVDAGGPQDRPSSEIVIGNTFTSFLQLIAPAASRSTLSTDAVNILTRCDVRGDVARGMTGLVVGRVQSGKTLSYEAVVALARDNGFALVVVISGISNPLLDQGVKRLRADLTKADGDGWNFLVNPAADPQTEATLRSTRDNWMDPETPAQLKKTAICLLLKHHGRIDSLTELCRAIGWEGLKVLIIDDEADQASLNVKVRKGQESTTYRNLLALRQAFPHHAYLQYTATPQAPLLVAISDVLSPDFVRVLEPGSEYVGGSDYFENPSGAVQVIPDVDLEAAADPNGPPPRSLRKALRQFLLGASHVVATGEAQTRSMLVHPSRLTASHLTFLLWIDSTIRTWRDCLEDGDDIDSLRREFHEEWASMRTRAPELSDFETCLTNLRFVFRNLQVLEMNARAGDGTPVIEWDTTKAYILIGGQAVDRGFTVAGLSVTYMPRDPGSWTADTIQQRARFFGYKRAYFNQCTVFLEPALRTAFEKYVAHEHLMLQSLRAIESNDSSLLEWSRSFYLDPAMRATRDSVVSIPTVSVSPGDRWIYNRNASITSGVAAKLAMEVDKVISQLELTDAGHGHLEAEVPISALISFLGDLPSTSDVESAAFRALRLQMARMLDSDPATTATARIMRPDMISRRAVKNGLVQPFQGASKQYPGDRALRSETGITVQFHRFNIDSVYTDAGAGASAPSSMDVFAFWIPKNLAGGWLLEETVA